MNKKIAIILPIAILALGVGTNTLLGATKPEPEKKEEAPRPLSLFVENVWQQSKTLDVETQGEVRAKTDVELIAQVGGRIVAVADDFTEGGEIKPGMPLIAIEAEDYRLAVTNAEANVAEAEMLLEQVLATADVARKQLMDENNPSSLALKKPHIAQARAKLKGAQASLEQAKLQMRRTQISLPFTGRVKSKNVGMSQYITPGTSLGRVFSTDTVEVRLPLTDSQLASLNLPIGYVAQNNKGPKVTFSAVVAGELRNWPGQLTRIDAAIDPTTRLLYGIAEVSDPYGKAAEQAGGMPLAVGLFVNASIEGRKIDDAQMITRAALRPGNKVYVITDNGKLAIRDVKTLHKDSKEVIVASGLNPSEQVVLSPMKNPISGMAVEGVVKSQSLNSDEEQIAKPNLDPQVEVIATSTLDADGQG